MDLGRQIPFAIRRQDKKIVSVDDVPNGLACDCICPACNGVLVAKKGPVNTHHFSHHEKSADLCQYAAFTSIRLMLLEVFELGLCSEQSEIELPSNKLEITLHAEAGKSFHGATNLTKPCPPVFGSLYNRYKPPQLLLTFAPVATQKDPEVCLAIHLPPAHPNQNLLTWLNEYTELWPRRGVLSVNYGAILSMLWSKTELPEEMPIIDRLLKIFFSKSYVFSWLYHPLEKSAREKLTAKLMKQKESWEQLRAQKAMINKQFLIKEEYNLDRMARQAPSFYEIYDNQSPVPDDSLIFTPEAPGMSVEEVVEFINATGVKPDNASALYPTLEIEVRDGWIIVEEERVWFVSAIKPSDWKTANVRYSAGMRKGLCVERTEALNKALKVKTE